MVAGPQAEGPALESRGVKVPDSQRRQGSVGRDLAQCDGPNNMFHRLAAPGWEQEAERQIHGPASPRLPPLPWPTHRYPVLGAVSHLPPPFCLRERPMALSFVP